jgi:signal transduction histidine kinase/DNA-binding NarL/FixJ family response regulator/HPt (histidine-containing phosphotransfer) domain-containing protein
MGSICIDIHSAVFKRVVFLTAFFLCLFFLCTSSFAQSETRLSTSKSLILGDLYSEHYLSPYLVRYGKEYNNLSAQEIFETSGIRAEETDISGSITLINMDEDIVWLGFDVMNRSSKAYWKIDFGSSFMGRFGLFEKVESFTYNKTDQTLWANEIQEDGSLLVEVPINQKSQVLIRLQSVKGIPEALPMRLISREKSTSIDNNRPLILALVLLVGMAFFFSAIALIKVSHSYLFFSAYYILLALSLVLQNNLIVADIPVLGSNIIPFSFLSVAIAALFISRLFWNMEYGSRFANMGFYSLIGFSLVCFFGGVFFNFDAAIIKTALLLGPTFFIFILIPLISIIQSQQGNDEATPFMFAWFILLFGICITVFSLSGIMQPVSTAINAYWYTLIPQALFFIIATRMKFGQDRFDMTLSQTLEITETDSLSRLRASKENTEQERLLKVIEQERKVLSELRKSEARRTEEMRKAKDEADIANKAKSAFLAVVSHEIRTPMTGIMGMVRLLLDSNLTKEQKEYAQTIQDSSDAMLALLNDILDFEKIEQGKMVFENISFDLHRLIQGVSTLMSGHAAQKNIELHTKIGDELPRYVKGDPNRLRQVLLNLTGNAVKFTNDGAVTITAELMKKSDSGDSYEIYFGVTDSGIGISEEAQKNLFNPFSQADSSISRKFGGTGLGLAISNGLVQGMGSNININSNEGEGSTFFFTLTMPSGQGSEAARGQRQPLKETVKPMNLLVVDDNEINLKVINGFLQKEPHKITMAHSGEEALEKINRESFDCVLMDIEMPGMKGDEVTTIIRQSDDPRIAKTPVIALTGNVLPDDIDRFYAAGMNDTLAKPIDSEKLKETLLKASQGMLANTNFEKPQTPQQKPVETPSATPVEPTAPTQEKPKDIKTETPSPVTKPEKKIVIEPSVIEVHQKPATADNKTEPAAEKEIVKDKAVFNTETLDTLKGHLAKQDIQDMIDDLKQKTGEIIADMNDALSKQDTDTLSAKGHELKGMAGNFGLTEVSKQAGEIEAKAKTQPIIVLTSMVSALPEMQKRAETALNQWLSGIE